MEGQLSPAGDFTVFPDGMTVLEPPCLWKSFEEIISPRLLLNQCNPALHKDGEMSEGRHGLPLGKKSQRAKLEGIRGFIAW